MATTSFTNLITLTDASWFNDADKAAYGYLTGVAGTNTITATGPASLSAYAAGNKFHFVPAATNTGATTINITQSGASALGAKNVFFNGAACVGGEIKIGVPCMIIYDGTQFQISGSDGLIWTNYAREPINTNPNFLVDQINEGGLYTASAGTVPGPDGWSGSATGAGVFKMRTLADPDNAALKCMEITCTTADAAIAATDVYQVYTAIEGNDVRALKVGTASAEKITVQFKFKSSVTGVYGLSVINNASNRCYVGTITVPDTAENAYSLTLTLDTSGTWEYTTSAGIYLRLCLAAGPDHQGTALAWAANNIMTTSAQCNFMSSNTNIAYLKRFHVVPSGCVLSYANTDIEKELAKCMRYYEKSYSQGVALGTASRLGGISTIYNAAIAGAPGFSFRVPKRITPTITGYSSLTGASGKWYDTTATDQNVTFNNTGIAGVENVSLAAGTSAYLGHYAATARLS